MNNLSGVTEREWDYLVVGTGMGGATVGHALARAGKRVLFLEKGTSPRKGPMTRGKSPEDTFTKPGPLTDEHLDALRRGGRYFQRYADHTHGAGKPFFPFMGSGVGGSSALYGAIHERFQPLDFTPRAAHPQATDSTIPQEWPVSYGEMIPYYKKAETIYSVQPAPLGPASKALFAKFTEQGLHPYALPTSCKFVEGCRNCQGKICERDCKIDSYKACLSPAIEFNGASLLEDCEVLSITADAHRVQDVRCRVDGQDIRIAAKTIVLGAGALETPRLLLNSTSTQWPRGLANGADQVGRNLMRHLVDLYVVNLALGPQTWGKEIGIPDFYATPTGKFGGIHGMGPMPVAASLVELQRALPMRLGGPIARAIVRALLNRFSSRFNLASFLEDLPYAENRVHGGSDLAFEYRISPYDMARLNEFRSRIKQALKPQRLTLLKQGQINERLFHACGTCRFGTDPSNSVLDKNNRAHDLENLYVVDASFFPTSGGTAPSLTIAANAIRVADHLLGSSPAAE